MDNFIIIRNNFQNCAFCKFLISEPESIIKWIIELLSAIVFQNAPSVNFLILFSKMKIYGNLNSMESYQFNKFLAFQQKHFLSNNLKKQKKVVSNHP